MSCGGRRLTVGQNCGRAQVASIRREARPRDPPGSPRGVLPTHQPSPRLPHRSRRSVPRPPPARPQQPLAPISPSPGRRRFVPPPRMTDTWPMPCMNKSGPCGHLPKAMPGQLITVNHPSATYERVGVGKQGSRPRNETVRLWETVHDNSYPSTCCSTRVSINHGHNDVWLSARVPARRVRSSR